MAGSIDRLKGTVKWFDVRRGFGFISPEDGGESVFVHQSSIKAVDYRSLAVGETVEFLVSVADDGRPRATDVTGPGGAYIKGRRYFGGACYRCGEVGHMAMDCKSNGGCARVGPCYRCREMGHLARECPAARIEPSSPGDNLSEPSRLSSISDLSPPADMSLDQPSKSMDSDEDEEFPSGVEERNWAELPRDVLSVIFKKIAAVEVIMSAQFVCKQCLQLSREPELWRCIDMMNEAGRFKMTDLESIAMMVVDRSEGCVEEFCAEYFGTDVLMGYLAGRATQLRCLRLKSVYNITDTALAQAIRRFPRLEELEISRCFFSDEVVEWIGLACPQLKSFKLTARPYNFEKDFESVESDLEENSDKEALAIAKHMQQLRCLQLFVNTLTSIGLSAILDNCLHLECLDISECLNFNLDENLKEKCARIKDLRLPNEYGYEVDTTTGELEAFDEDFESASFDTEYDFPYDDYGFYDYDGFFDMSSACAF